MTQLIKKIMFLTLLGVSFAINALSADLPVKISVTANHADWVYKLNEKVKFNVIVTKEGKPLDNVEVSYEVAQEKMTPMIKKTEKLKNGQLEIEGGTLTTPGFLRCIVTTNIESVKYRGLATAGFEPENIKPTTTVPEDFVQFWDKAKADNAKIPMDAKLTLLPEKCTEKVNVYHLSLQNYKVGGRAYGILCVPKAPGKYPAILQVPGAGVRPYNGDIRTAENGIITLQIGIHGIPVNLDPVVYSNLSNAALDGYPTFNLDNKDTYYYKHVYLGCVRAIDYIFTMPEFDGSSMAVQGGSQGGALSIITTALDSRVKYLSCFYPALSDLTGYLYGRAGGWPHMFSNKDNATTAKVETSRYYDVVNFAKLIKVPGFYTFGFNDETCPPTSMFSAYNSINAPKDLFIVKETGHNTVAEQNVKSGEFIFKQLNIKLYLSTHNY